MMAQQMMAQQQAAAQQQVLDQQMMAAQQQQIMAQRAEMQNMLNNMGNNNTMNQQSGQSFTPQSQGQGISVIFRVSINQANVQTGPAITIQCTLDEKVGTIIERYRNKTGDKDTTKKFIFNAKSLNPTLSLAEAGITHNANIFVMVTKDIKGAF